MAIQIASTHFINVYVSEKMHMNMEGSNWFVEIPFYFFTTCQYLVISFLLHNLHEQFKQKKALAEIKMEKLNTEVNYLKAQINPHFLFNTLNNLYSLSLQKSDKAPTTILMLSKMMDYMLYETSDSKVSLKKEIENIDNYIGLQRIRQGNDANIKYTVKGEITDQKIVPLVLLPLIENAFKHGANEMIHGAYIQITFNIEITQLKLLLENNYKEKEKNDNHGIGLINLKKQLELFYPNKFSLELIDKESVFIASLMIDLS